MLDNGFENAIEIGQNIIIPEADHGITVLGQYCCANPICSPLCMLAAIKLDDEIGFPTGEVGDVRADRKLPREFGPIAGQQLPHLALFRRGV